MPIVRRLGQHKLLLDTHIWLWLMAGETRLKPSFRKDALQAANAGLLMVSAISVWEIAMLAQKDRIELGMDVSDWVDDALKSPGPVLVPLSPRIAIQSARLPGKLHGDPADRILVATARQENAILVTCDRALLKFGPDPFIGVYNPKTSKTS